jgi:hypothetical protein
MYGTERRRSLHRQCFLLGCRPPLLHSERNANMTLSTIERFTSNSLFSFPSTGPRLLGAHEVGAGSNDYIDGRELEHQMAGVLVRDDFEDAAHVAPLQLDATF